MAAELDAEARARLLDALARGESQRQAAVTSGYTHTHVKRLLQSPEFRSELEAARARVDRVPEGEDTRAARSFLLEVVAGKVEGPAPEVAVRVAAAKALLARPRPAPVAAKSSEPVRLVSLEGGKAAAEKWLEAQ